MNFPAPFITYFNITISEEWLNSELKNQNQNYTQLQKAQVY